MLFNSFSYAVFLPVVFILYWMIPHRYRWGVLLAASYYFYMSWNPKYIILILWTTLVSYYAAILIEQQSNVAKKRMILTIAAVICLGLLFFFKYFNFISQSITDMCRLFRINTHPITLHLLLPVGISFYTFQTLSYVIDVYKGTTQAEHHFGIYAAFVSFFPQLVAGPIERSNNLLPQIKATYMPSFVYTNNNTAFDYSCASYGLKLIAWGLFKKIVIADSIAVFTGKVFTNPMEYNGFGLLFSIFSFSIQIYCDFSGYSDIAVGSSKLFGINLMTNFKSPYFSQSIREFWSRWHISLSTWFRDYVYIPLGGNRKGKFRKIINLVITFLVSGLWHGANWIFVIWGGLHGLGQVIENSLIPKDKQSSNRILRFIKIILVYLFCSFTWVFFVSSSLSDALYIITHFFNGITNPLLYLKSGFFLSVNISKFDLICLFISLIILVIYDYISIRKDVIALITSQTVFIRWSIYIAFSIWVLLNVSVNDAAEFIYFQF